MSHPNDLNEQITAMRNECRRLEHACQLAWGTGNYYAIKATDNAYDIAYVQLSKLIKRRMKKMSLNTGK